jgi:hypothetical protein
MHWIKVDGVRMGPKLNKTRGTSDSSRGRSNNRNVCSEIQGACNSVELVNEDNVDDVRPFETVRIV